MKDLIEKLIIAFLIQIRSNQDNPEMQKKLLRKLIEAVLRLEKK